MTTTSRDRDVENEGTFYGMTGPCICNLRDERRDKKRGGIASGIHVDGLRVKECPLDLLPAILYASDEGSCHDRWKKVDVAKCTRVIPIVVVPSRDELVPLKDTNAKGSVKAVADVYGGPGCVAPVPPARRRA